MGEFNDVENIGVTQWMKFNHYEMPLWQSMDFEFSGH